MWVVAVNPADYRYVDNEGTPLKAEDPRPFAEFEMMPIRLMVEMDQRKVPNLLVHCANSSMHIDVRRVVLNPGVGKPFDLGPFAAATTTDGSAAASGMAEGAVAMGYPGGWVVFRRL